MCNRLVTAAKSWDRAFPQCGHISASTCIPASHASHALSRCLTHAARFLLTHSLSLSSLHSCVSQVSSLTSLTHLDLSHNMLSSLPPTCLPLSLRTLLLDNNQLADVPEAVTHLASRPGLFSRDGAAAAGHVVTAPGTSLTGANAGGSSSSGAGSSSCSPARTHPTASAECAGSQHVSGSGRAGSGLQALTLSHNYLMGVPGFGWQLAGLTALTRLELTNVSDAYSGPLTITPEVRSLCAHVDCGPVWQLWSEL